MSHRVHPKKQRKDGKVRNQIQRALWLQDANRRVWVLLVLISVSPNILVAELFRSNLVGMILLWAGSLLAFLVPFALFSEIDLKRQLDPSYGSLKSSVRRNARVFALLGFGFSLINVYFLADYLSRVLNVAS